VKDATKYTGQFKSILDSCLAWNLPHGPYQTGARHMSLRESSEELACDLAESEAEPLLAIVSAFLGEPVPVDWRALCIFLSFCLNYRCDLLLHVYLLEI
jgi:hypothetical protein